MDTERYKIINGNNLEVLDTIEENSIDAIITDPPYELGFMGKTWDKTGIAYNEELWEKALRVLKPGGYLLAFGGTRTYHRIASAIERGGFEIRDCIMWVYGSGFPKSHNIGLDIDKLNGCGDRGHRIAVASRTHPDGTIEPNGDKLPAYETKTEEAHKWNGWGTALKPAYEPIVVARKQIEGTVAKNCLKYGVGGINIDECRVGDEVISIHDAPAGTFAGGEQGRGSDTESYRDSVGRFPANLILTYDETDFEEVCGGMPYTKGTNPRELGSYGYCFEEGKRDSKQMSRGYIDEGSAARYFYCAKASKKDRDEGLDMFEEISTGQLQGGRKEGSAGSQMLNEDGTTRINPYAGAGGVKKNVHPTVKPTTLMQYLVRLISPKGATILDIFNGSGSTGKAVAYENKERNANYKYIGIELNEEYCQISEARISYVEKQPIQLDLFDEEE